MAINMENYEKYKAAFSYALEMDEDAVQTLKYRDGNWDSVSHMSLIAELEKVFSIEFKSNDIVEFDSFDKGIDIIKKYGILINNL